MWNEIVIILEDVETVISSGGLKTGEVTASRVQALRSTDLDEKIDSIRLILDHIEGLVQEDIEFAVPGMPNLRKYITRTFFGAKPNPKKKTPTTLDDKPEKLPKIRLNLQNGVTPSTIYANNPIDGLIFALSQKEAAFDFTTRCVEDEIELLMHERPELRATIYPWFMDIIGRLALVYEIRDAIEKFVWRTSPRAGQATPGGLLCVSTSLRIPLTISISRTMWAREPLP